MSLVPRLFRRAALDGARVDERSTGVPGPSFPLVSTPLAARATPCPGDPGRAQVVVLDGAAVPGVAHYRSWQLELAAHGVTGIRTGALAARQAAQAELAGLHCAQELVLLRLDAPLPRPARSTTGGDTARHDTARHDTGATRLQRLAGDGYRAAATIDRVGFGDRWHLDAGMLEDICGATPRARARLAVTDGVVSGFLISGRAGNTGYIQRLAVDVTARRHGVATTLIADAFGWMRRFGVRHVYVNTHTDNEVALALYHRLGFRDLAERLRVYEGDAQP